MSENTTTTPDLLKLGVTDTPLLNIPSVVHTIPDTPIHNPNDVYISTDSTTPLQPMITFSEHTPTLQFIYNLFFKHPEYFTTTAETLMYACNSGKTFKPESYYNSFETFVQITNDSYISDVKKNMLKHPFTYDRDYIITWGRIIHESKVIKTFEPVMNHLKKALNNWCIHKPVFYNGKRYEISDFKPLLYTCSGESIITLLPYIAYVITFFIHCNPYAFDDITSDSSLFSFYNSIEAHMSKYLSALGDDFGIDFIKELTVSEEKAFEKLISTIPVEDWKACIEKMLDPSTIVKIRNDEIQKTEGLLETVVSLQNSLTEGFVCDAFQQVLNELVNICIKQNPVAKLVQLFPTPYTLTETPFMKQLMHLTEYMLSGSSALFNIQISGRVATANDTGIISSNNSLVYTSRYTYNPTIPDIIYKPIGLQTSITSKINSVSTSIGKPFCSSDIHLKLVSGFVKEEIDKKLIDTFDDFPLQVDPLVLLQSPNDYKEFVNRLFVNGMWNLSRKSIKNILKSFQYDALNVSALTDKTYQASKDRLEHVLEQFDDVSKLSAIVQLCYENPVASVLITPLILSEFTFMSTSVVASNSSLTSLLPYMLLHEIDFKTGYHKALVSELISFLHASLYINDPHYCDCVNVAANRITALLSTDPLMYQTFIRGLDDSADVLSIGGSTLYEYASNNNPMMRGYGFVSTVLGLDENAEAVKQYVALMKNTDMFDVIEQDKFNSGVIESFMKVHWTNLYTNKSVPRILANYNFTGIDSKHPMGYSIKNVPYIVDLIFNPDGINQSVIGLFAKYAFMYADPKRSITKEICFKQIELKSTGGAIVYPTTINQMKVQGRNTTGKNIYAVNLSATGTIEEILILDHTAEIDRVGMIYTNPGGLRRIVIRTFSSSNDIENIYWVFTNTQQESRFMKYKRV